MKLQISVFLLKKNRVNQLKHSRITGVKDGGNPYLKKKLNYWLVSESSSLSSQPKN